MKQTKQQQQDAMYMQVALDLARKAASAGEVPVGAIIVDADGAIIGRGYNQRESLQDPLAHAEITAIAQAAHRTGFWRLEKTTLYVTLEPCPMCSGAILNARIPRVVYGTRDHKAGAVDSLFNLLRDDRLNHRCKVTDGVEKERCSTILSAFFKSLRQKNTAPTNDSNERVFDTVYSRGATE